MDHAEARAAALDMAQRAATWPVAIRDELTIEKPFGWVFFWWRARSPRAGSQVAVGNAPIVVDRASGSALFLGTAFPCERYVCAYEALGESRFAAGEWREFILERYSKELDDEGDP